MCAVYTKSQHASTVKTRDQNGFYAEDTQGSVIRIFACSHSLLFQIRGHTMDGHPLHASWFTSQDILTTALEEEHWHWPRKKKLDVHHSPVNCQKSE